MDEYTQTRARETAACFPCCLLKALTFCWRGTANIKPLDSTPSPSSIQPPTLRRCRGGWEVVVLGVGGSWCHVVTAPGTVALHRCRFTARCSPSVTELLQPSPRRQTLCSLKCAISIHEGVDMPLVSRHCPTVEERGGESRRGSTLCVRVN